MGALFKVLEFVAAALILTAILALALAEMPVWCNDVITHNVLTADFGGFAIDFLAKAAALKYSNTGIPMLVLLAFFWIAPFYGYFHEPWFAAQALISPCHDANSLCWILMLVAMIAGAWAGTNAAIKLFKPSSNN